MTAVNPSSRPGNIHLSTNNKELSGAKWAKRFPGSNNTRDLSGTFRQAVDDFIYAMREAGIKVAIDATQRPIQRSYLMHWSWRIVNDGVAPETIPALAGVEIEWAHPVVAGAVKAAREMVDALSIRRLRIKPALRSQHNLGLAIDMAISWRGMVSVKDGNGKVVPIKTIPRTGMNRQLIAIGTTYGVKKYSGGGQDAPHWSNNGR